MKHLTYSLTLVIILLVSACHKDSIAVKSTTKNAVSLPGKWKVIGNMLSAGGPMYFVPTSSTAYVTFNTDGTLGGSAYPDYGRYTVKDSVTLKMTSANNTNYENFLYTIKHDTLTLGLAGPTVCTEGCAVVLVKE